MTPEQVSALSDVELNRAMIWLYPPEHRKYDPFEDDGSNCWSGNYEDLIDYDYLGDYNQAMPLAVECGLAIEFNPQGTFAGLGYSESTNDNPLRAICEVLVLIKCQ